MYAALSGAVRAEEPEKENSLKLTMRLQGFIRMAGATRTLRFGMLIMLLLSASAGAIYGLWTIICLKLDTALGGGCTDTGAETGETSYVPSKLVAQCTQSAHIATLMLISIFTVLVVCGVIALLTWAFDNYAERAYKRGHRPAPAKLYDRTDTVRRRCGYVAFAMVFAVVMVITPRG